MRREELMLMQEDPDGLMGHEEREALRDMLLVEPQKAKYTGRGKEKSEFTLLQEEELRKMKEKVKQDEWKAEMERIAKSKKGCFKHGCNLENCKRCKKNPNRKVNKMKVKANA